MKSRLGIILLVLTTIGILVGINASFDLLNQADDMSVIVGMVIISAFFLFSPLLYRCIAKLITSKSTKEIK